MVVSQWGVLCRALRCLRYLRYLDCYGERSHSTSCRWLTDDMLRELLLGGADPEAEAKGAGHTLQWLRLRHSGVLTDAAMALLGRYARCLQGLDVRGCPLLTADGVSCLAAARMPCLEVLLLPSQLHGAAVNLSGLTCLRSQSKSQFPSMSWHVMAVGASTAPDSIVAPLFSTSQRCDDDSDTDSDTD